MWRDRTELMQRIKSVGGDDEVRRVGGRLLAEGGGAALVRGIMTPDDEMTPDGRSSR